ncbi:MAG: hypothetical protein CMJ18_00265 [Phycisphaeraceae bacterium]|nr:hypothetical protein [Phycisphaeraceae bacterium]
MALDSPAGSLTSPFDLPDDEGYVWLKGNLHSHTTNSDGKPSPQERVDGYAQRGYDYLCMSDHYTITRIDSVDCPENLTLIQGAELHPDNPFGGQRHHLLCLNLQEDIDSTRMPPQHVIDAVNEQGGAVFLAHPHWSSVNIHRDILPLRGLAGIEVFNTICRCAARGESSVHWDDWMEQENRLYPGLANDDAHALDADEYDTCQGWTWARVKQRSGQAIVDALMTGASYGSTGPVIHDIQLRRVDDEEGQRVIEASIRCSEAQRIFAVADNWGNEYREKSTTFEAATFTLRPGARWTRFEIVGPDGRKAWSNPFDLTKIERA